MAGTSESWCLPDRCDEAAAVSRMTSIDVQYEFGFFLHVEHLQRDALKKVETSGPENRGENLCPRECHNSQRALSFVLLLWMIAAVLFAGGRRVALSQQLPSPGAAWISFPNSEPCPVNRFVYFRREVRLASLRGDLTLHVAADSTAHIWINGRVVRRKVTRYFEPSVTTETIDARQFVHLGLNTVVILNHSWGPIVTFQRSGCAHAGIFVSSSWVNSDSTWRSRTAKEFAPNDEQIVGVPPAEGAQGDHRIRFAQFLYGGRVPSARLFYGGYDDSSWSRVDVVKDGPWTDTPAASETPGQHEIPVKPWLLLAEGQVLEPHVEENDPKRIESAMLHGKYEPRGDQALVLDSIYHFSKEIEVKGRAGVTRYVTFDFGRPVHGFPFLYATALQTEPIIDFAYGELNRSPSTGKFLVNSSGWLDPEAIVGRGYIDRYYARLGQQHFELPDERTARWWTIHVYFPRDGLLRISQAGFISSQYPTDLKGSFRCGDKRLDQIVRLSLEHAIVSMSDTYVDTPGREDGQWLEDARLRAQLAAQWFGDIRLRQLLLRLAAQSQTPDGHLHPFPPSNYPILANADWSAEWIGALYDDYLWTGKTSRLRLYWPEVIKWWNLVLSNVDSNGLWRESRVFADIRIGVHPLAGQSSGIASAQIIQRLTLSIAMAKAIGDNEDSAVWSKTRDNLVSAFRQYHLVKASGGVPLHADDVADPGNPLANRGFSQAAQAMTIEAGLLTPDEATDDLDYSFAAPNGTPRAGVDRWNNPTYLYRSLDALTQNEYSQRALQHLLERCDPYLPQNIRNPNPLILQGPWGGPLPEYWISREDLALSPTTLNPAQPIDPTGSHGWNSVALVWLHDSLLGVRILEPGGGLLQIKPDTAGLKYVEGTTMTPKGAVFVSWKPLLTRLAINLPSQVVAIVELPPELTRMESLHKLQIPHACALEALDRYRCGGRTIIFRMR